MKKDKEQIFNALKEILIDLFEVSEADIVLEANLYEDLDLDSIDSIDLILKLQEVTGVKVAPDEFKQTRTISDVVDTVFGLLNN